jgi:SWI/SNF-related matrix-associated actin-dependent regulator 1 of chromatin subfamily A
VRGGQGDATKQAEIDDFVSGKSRVLIGQVTAAGVGLTLHGNGLNHRVVVAQLPWTPADLLQAEDRLHRIGQTHDVMVEIGISNIDGMLTIDERLWNMLEAKYFASKTITEGEGEWLLDEVQDGLLDSYRQ